MPEIKLLPCPFCGGEARLKKRTLRFPAATYYIPQCKNEHCMGRSNKLFHTQYHAMVAWNQRAGNGDRIERWYEDWLSPRET